MTANTVQVDIVSDVVCPWCYVGFRQLEQALGMTGLGAVVRWHPFELNPDMPPEGQNLREHLMQKYGITAEASQTARARLTALGAELGIDFRYSDGMRMVNTFAAHQLLGERFAVKHRHFGGGRKQSMVVSMRKFDSEVWRSAKKKSRS